MITYRKTLVNTLLICLFNLSIIQVNTAAINPKEKATDKNTATSGQEKFQITHGPYLCNPSQDGVSIVWTTNRPALSWVEIAPDDGSHFYAQEREMVYATEAGRKLVNKTLHQVRLENLQPGTTYRYRIVSKEVLEWKSNSNILYGITASTSVNKKGAYTFRTLKDQGDEVTFAIINDIHGKAASIKKLCQPIDFEKIDMLFLNGDMTSHINSEKQIFAEYIDTLVSLCASETPLVLARGNHETRGEFADELINYFPTKDGKFYQSFNVGDINFLVLDCGEDKPDSDIEYSGLADYDAYREKEARWLKTVIQSEPFLQSKKKIAILHIPLVWKTYWHGMLHLRQTLLPLLNESGVQIMFSGHTHSYNYLPPVKGEINFPTLINDEENYVLCKVKDGKIKIEIYGVNGLLHSHLIE